MSVAPTANLNASFDAFLNTCGGFEAPPHIALAVSGGADSMALMYLAAGWAEKKGAKLTALTVDHGLRKTSAQEALHVKQHADLLGIPHHTLNVEMKDQTAAIQQQARDLRYTALENYCMQHGILHLLTAHHLHDNIETLAMRAWRGSGIEGLAGIPTIRYTNHLRILRPLLNQPKDQLVKWLTRRNITWIEDASNQSAKYERNRIRHNFNQWPIPPAEALDFFTQMGSALNAAQHMQAQIALESIHAFAEGYLIITTRHWPHFRAAYLISLLRSICLSLGTDPQPPRYRKLEALLKRLLQNSPKASCLAGLKFSPLKNGQWLITRELAHLPAPQPIQENTQFHWDHRFHIQLHRPLTNAYVLKALGAQGVLELKKQDLLTHVKLPRSALLTLPAIWHLDHPVLVPHINISQIAGLSQQITFQPRWRLPLLGTPHRYSE